jgi:hypothetical protein
MMITDNLLSTAKDPHMFRQPNSLSVSLVSGVPTCTVIAADCSIHIFSREPVNGGWLQTIVGDNQSDPEFVDATLAKSRNVVPTTT